MIQWFAIWAISAYAPYGVFLIISPVLISFLIIFVSGIKPLEKKMASHPDFKKYAENTPSVIPITVVNGILYYVVWYLCIQYGAKGPLLIPIVAGLLFFLIQVPLFYRYDSKSFLTCAELSLYALVLGFLQEKFFIYTHTLAYEGHIHWPPIWLLILYPVFSLTLNSSLSFLNKNIGFSFILAGIGACFSYLVGEKLNAVVVNSIASYATIFISWGVFISALIYLNRKLSVIYEDYTNKKKLETSITVFFDTSCSICAKEMSQLKKRKQTGLIIYEDLSSQSALKKTTTAFSYKEAMATIHGLTHDGKIIKGIDTLSALYARTNLPFLAILLRAPLFNRFFRIMYWMWAKIRVQISKKR